MKFHGNIDLNNNELQKVVMQTETDFPASPPVGRLVFRQKRLFIAAELDGSSAPIWVPLTNTINTYVHRQESSSATWTVTHNLNTSTPLVMIYDDVSNQVIIPDQITPTDNNTITVTLGVATTGRCVLMSGELTGAGQPAYSYVYTQTSSSSTWVINHALGYNPIVRAFAGNTEITPTNITHNTINQVTLTFAIPYVGVARLI
jgi:hypothetical protein